MPRRQLNRESRNRPVSLALFFSLVSPASAGQLGLNLSGYAFEQASGQERTGDAGHAVTSEDGVRFWEEVVS